MGKYRLPMGGAATMEPSPSIPGYEHDSILLRLHHRRRWDGRAGPGKSTERDWKPDRLGCRGRDRTEYHKVV